MIWESVFNNWSCRCVRSWACLVSDDCWRHESVFGLRHWKPLGRAHDRRELALSNALQMAVWTRTRQLLLRIIVEFIIFVHSIAVAIKLLSHWEMNALPSKGWVLLVCVWRRSIDFFRMVVNYPFNVLLLDGFARDSEWKAGRSLAESVILLTKVLRTSVIRVRAWQISVLLACVVILEASLMSAESVWSWSVEALDSREIAWLVKCRWTNAFRVWFDCRESWTLAKGVSGLRRGVRQGRWCHLSCSN